MPDKPLHDDVPLDHAWITGRRTYVRCPKNSTLNEQLIDLGSKWDWDLRARWVGTPAKRAQVLQFVLADREQRRVAAQAQQDLLASGWRVPVPQEMPAAPFFTQAGQLGGVWDQAKREFVLPGKEARDVLRQEVDTWTEKQRADRERTNAERIERERVEAIERVRADTERARVAAERAEQERQQVMVDSGRTSLGDTVIRHKVSTQRMNTATATASAWPVGSVRKLRDGRRGLVVARRVWFTDQHDATDLDWHQDAPDEAHWNFHYTLEIIEATADEIRADAEAAAVRADAAEIAGLFAELARRSRTYEGSHTRVADVDRVGSISGSSGTPGTSSFGIGTVVLAVDGRVVWHHPGFYDDYTPTETVTTDPELVARVRALLDTGARTRTVHGQLVTTYVVTVAS